MYRVARLATTGLCCRCNVRYNAPRGSAVITLLIGVPLYKIPKIGLKIFIQLVRQHFHRLAHAWGLKVWLPRNLCIKVMSHLKILNNLCEDLKSDVFIKENPLEPKICLLSPSPVLLASRVCCCASRFTWELQYVPIFGILRNFRDVYSYMYPIQCYLGVFESYW